MKIRAFWLAKMHSRMLHSLSAAICLTIPMIMRSDFHILNYFCLWASESALAVFCSIFPLIVCSLVEQLDYSD